MDEALIENICAFKPLFRAILIVHIVLLTMLGFAIPALERGTDTFVVWVLAAITLTVSAIFLFWLIRQCTAFEQ